MVVLTPLYGGVRTGWPHGTWHTMVLLTPHPAPGHYLQLPESATVAHYHGRYYHGTKLSYDGTTGAPALAWHLSGHGSHPP